MRFRAPGGVPRRVFGAIVLLLLFSSSIEAASSLTVAWDPNTDSGLAGYVVYYGTARIQKASFSARGVAHAGEPVVSVVCHGNVRAGRIIHQRQIANRIMHVARGVHQNAGSRLFIMQSGHGSCHEFAADLSCYSRSVKRRTALLTLT